MLVYLRIGALADGLGALADGLGALADGLRSRYEPTRAPIASTVPDALSQSPVGRFRDE